MNAEDYEKVCLDHLSDKTFYEQLPNDPTPIYKDEITTAVNEMHAKKYVTDFEKATMLTGERTKFLWATQNSQRLQQPSNHQ